MIMKDELKTLVTNNIGKVVGVGIGLVFGILYLRKFERTRRIMGESERIYTSLTVKSESLLLGEKRERPLWAVPGICKLKSNSSLNTYEVI